MKTIMFVIFALCLFTPCRPLHAQARQYTLGLGFVLGNPSGVSVKYWTSTDNALDFALGWGSGTGRFNGGNDNAQGATHTHFHVDYLWHAWNAIHSSQRFPLFYGFGGSVESAAGYSGVFSVRGVFGLAWMPRWAPLDIFIEVAPSVPVSGAGGGLYFDGAFGARFFFS